MQDKKETRTRGQQVLHWIPRVLGILFCVFISIFALDVFGEYSGVELVVALFMHLVPTFIAVGVLLVSWKWPLPGGIIYAGLAVVYVVLTRGRMGGPDDFYLAYIIISGPLLLTGILFIVNHFKLPKKTV